MEIENKNYQFDFWPKRFNSHILSYFKFQQNVQEVAGTEENVSPLKRAPVLTALRERIARQVAMNRDKP